MMRWIRSLFSWRLCRCTGVWAYYENSVTGERRARRVSSGHQPIDFEWLGKPKGFGCLCAPRIEALPEEERQIDRRVGCVYVSTHCEIDASGAKRRTWQRIPIKH